MSRIILRRPSFRAAQKASIPRIWEKVTPSELRGKTISVIEEDPNRKYIKFFCEDKTEYIMEGESDSVHVDYIIGDLSDVCGAQVCRTDWELMYNNVPDDRDMDGIGDWHLLSAFSSYRFTSLTITVMYEYVTIRFLGGNQNGGSFPEGVKFVRVA